PPGRSGLPVPDPDPALLPAGQPHLPGPHLRRSPGAAARDDAVGLVDRRPPEPLALRRRPPADAVGGADIPVLRDAVLSGRHAAGADHAGEQRPELRAALDVRI